MASPRVETPNLILIAGTAALARADITSRPDFARLLGADVPAEWPQRDFADIQELSAQKLEDESVQPGWWHWYAVRKAAGANPPVLIGTGGFGGGPDDAGSVVLGYGILPPFEGRKYGTEIAQGLAQWASTQPSVARILATTFEQHVASVRILEKCGFACRGVSSEDAAASDADRQGRGRLMLFAKEFTALPLNS